MTGAGRNAGAAIGEMKRSFSALTRDAINYREEKRKILSTLVHSTRHDPTRVSGQ